VSWVCGLCGAKTFEEKQGIVEYSDFSGPSKIHYTRFKFPSTYIQCTKCGEVKILESSYQKMLEVATSQKGQTIREAEIIIANLLIMVLGVEPPMDEAKIFQAAYEFIGGKKALSTKN
jgi:hypothetical protein